MENKKLVLSERLETKADIELEVMYALRNFMGDLRSYIDSGTRVGVEATILNELEYVIKTVDRSQRVIERELNDQLNFPFPGNSW